MPMPPQGLIKLKPRQITPTLRHLNQIIAYIRATQPPFRAAIASFHSILTFYLSSFSFLWQIFSPKNPWLSC